VTDIIIESDQYSIPDLEAQLRLHLTNDEIQLRVERSRELGTAVLVAIVGVGGSAIGSLISGILRWATEKGARKIVIHGSSGRKLELPSDTPSDRIAELIQMAKEIDVEGITI
jgi:hypothetical protein